MKKILHPPKADWHKLIERDAPSYEVLEKEVRPILKDIKKDGDKALRKYVQKFDKVKLDQIQVQPEEFQAATQFVSDDLKKAIQVAKYNIAKFHIAQKESSVKKIQTMDGISCWRKSTAISKIGLYIPSGNAPLFSTILMLGIPANMAG